MRRTATHEDEGVGRQGMTQWHGTSCLRLRRLEPPEEAVLPVHNVAVFVPLVRYGSRAWEVLGAEPMSLADVGPESYLALLEEGGPRHLRFLGGFDTAARTVAEVHLATARDPWGLQAEVTPAAAIHSLAGQAFLRALRGAQEHQMVCTMVLCPHQGSAGSESVRLCIWAAHVPEEVTALDLSPMAFPTDVHLVPIQRLLDLRAMTAWRSFALRQHVSDAIGLLLHQGEHRRRQCSPSLTMAWPPLRVRVQDSVSLATAWRAHGGGSRLAALPESLILRVMRLAGAHRALRLGMSSRGLWLMVGRQLQPQAWSNTVSEWDGGSCFRGHSCAITTWWLGGTGGWLLDGLANAREGLTWLLLRLLRLTWTLAPQYGTPFYLSLPRPTIDGWAAAGQRLWVYFQEAEQQTGMSPDNSLRLDRLRPLMASVLHDFYESLLQNSFRERSQTSWTDLAQLDLSMGRGEDLLRRLEIRPGPGSNREAHRRQRQCWEAHRRRTMTPLRLTAAVEFLRVFFAYPVGTAAVREAEQWSQQREGPGAVTLPLVPRLAAVQAVIGWLWPHLRTLEGGELLCRVVRQYVLHDMDLRVLAGGLHMTAAETDMAIESQMQEGNRGVRSERDCTLCCWPQIGMSFMGCRCRSGIAPSHLWDAGLLEMGTAASVLAWEAHRDPEAGANGHNGQWALGLALPVVRHEQGFDRTAVGIWSSGDPLTVQLRSADSEDWQGDDRLWKDGRLRVRALGARAAAMGCVAESCAAPATSTCRYTPRRCAARRCAAGCTGGSTGEWTSCRCEGNGGESGDDEGWPVDLEVRSSDWGPGSRAERLGARRHWIEAADGGCCSLPDGWGTDRLPAHMERVVRSWEDEEGHGRYVDRQQQVLVSSGARRHACTDLVQTVAAGSTTSDRVGALHDEVGGIADVDHEKVPRGTIEGKL